MSQGADNAPQRAYRATCSFCGADVTFRSAASASAVCSYCRSTLVRDGETLRKVGESAVLFDDRSPLQMGASGRTLGEAFTLIGRVQWAYAAGTWTEWRLLFDNGRNAWLSEDNAGHVFSLDTPVPADAPAPGTLQAGQRALVDGRAWDVASVNACTWKAAEGELTWVPRKGEAITVVDLRNAQDEVGTLEYRDGRAAQWSIGRAVALADLSLQGLRGPSERKVASRGLECPSCGVSIELKLDSTRTVVCPQCQAVVDVSQGIGGDLAHYRQAQGDHEPQLPLGSIGRFAFGGGRTVPWQVVGYQERRDVPIWAATMSKASGASTCCSTRARGLSSWSTPTRAGAGCGRSPACRWSRAARRVGRAWCTRSAGPSSRRTRPRRCSCWASSTGR